MAHTPYRYGWQPDLPDQRDFAYMAPKPFLKQLPTKVDLRKQPTPAVYDQGQLGSCTANAIAGAFEFELLKQGSTYDFMPSRLFIYYNERVIEHSVRTDRGAQIRDGIKSVHKQGVCPETQWPYIENKFASKPPTPCYKSALQHQVLTYERMPRNLNQMKACLSSGYPFVIGFTVYESFESEAVAQTGKMPMPKKNESVVGGHAVLVMGYDDKSSRFIVRNSWNTDWGQQGYFTMPYAYLMDENLSDDFWTLRIIELNPSTAKAKAAHRPL